MKKLLVILCVVALPAVAFAEEGTGPGLELKSHLQNATPRSYLQNDLFHSLAHVCNSNGGLPCGPDNVLTNPFSGVIDVYFPTSQVYTRYYIVLDLEGNVVFLNSATSFISSGFNTFFFSGIVVNTGLYRFLSLIVGNNGVVAFSDYYRFRVVP